MSAICKFFLSYKRHVEPDESLAREIHTRLRANGHDVFIDQNIPTGAKWGPEIDRQIRECNYLVVLLTAESTRSEMVQSEIEKARGLGKTILPVRVCFAGELPYPLSAYLDPIQFAWWRGSSDTGTLIVSLIKAISGVPLSDTGAAQSQMQEFTNLPPAPSGGMDLEDPYYTLRPPDYQALALAKALGQTIVVKGPRQIGKTSLLFRMIDVAQKASKSVAFVNCQLFENASLEYSDILYERFTEAIAESLNITERPQPKTPQELSLWMEKEVLKKIGGPVTLAMDESERLLWAGTAKDLFAMLRTWHELRGNPIRKIWKNLDLFLVTSTEPALFIEGTQSPFNVGTVLPLPAFDMAGMIQLNHAYGDPLRKDEVIRLYELVNGQPYLVRKALYEVSAPHPRLTPDMLFAKASEDGGPFDDHLRQFLFALQDIPTVLAAFKEVLQDRGCSDLRLAYRLKAAGLTVGSPPNVMAGCKLYRDYFRARLS